MSVHLDGVEDNIRRKIAGMLRGLVCAIEGWGSISGVTNEVFTSNPVVLTFSSVENAHYFKERVENYFSIEIRKALKVKKRFFHSYLPR